MRRCFVAGVLLALVWAGCSQQSQQGADEQNEVSEPLPEIAPDGAPRLRTVYVPAYSHLPRDAKQHKSLLSVLLSVRNVDSRAVITLTHVDYFDTSGHRVRRYLKRPRSLRPLETAEFLVDTLDDVGGSGANFLVYWQGPSDAHPLLTETVMWGYVGQGLVSFTSRGVELDRRPDPKAFMHGAPASPPKPKAGGAAAVAP